MIILKQESEIQQMRKGGEIIGRFFEEVRELVRPGTPGEKIEEFARKFIISHGGYPSFLNYRGYPASICLSINDEVVHGIPFGKKIPEAGLVKIDIGVKYGCCHVDSAFTFIVGEIPRRAKKLVEITQKALQEGIRAARKGNRVSDISRAIERTVKPYRFGIIRKLVGHGVGFELHEDPEIPNYTSNRVYDPILKPGMTFAIEPMITLGTHKIKEMPDGWTIKTADGSWAAHFEHTVAITEEGTLVLTSPPEDHS